MKTFTLIFFMFSLGVAAQPDPRDFYPIKLEEINERLKNDSSNTSLRWSRAYMKIELMRSSWSRFESPFNEQEEVDCNSFNCQEIEADLDVALNNRSYGYEGDFYVQRLIYYDKTRQFAKAIHDALYLKDSLRGVKGVSERRFEYCRDYGIRALPGLYILNKEYNKALIVLDECIAEERKNNESNYYTVSYSSTSFVTKKLDLFYHTEQKEKHIQFLKSLYLEHFEYYFAKKKAFNEENLDDFGEAKKRSIQYNNNKYLDRVRQAGFYYLCKLADVMLEYEHVELKKYQELCDELRNPEKKSEYDSDFNLEIDDLSLKNLLGLD